METSNVKLGSDIDSWCSKCKMMLAHTIEAMVDGKPARVLCNTCKSSHNYRPKPPGVVSRPARQRDDGEPATHTRRPGTSRYQSLLKTKTESVVKAYSPTTKFELGDVLEHPTFGRGVAITVKEGSKIEVLFESGSKTLVHER